MMITRSVVKRVSGLRSSTQSLCGCLQEEGESCPHHQGSPRWGDANMAHWGARHGQMASQQTPLLSSGLCLEISKGHA